MTSPNYWINWLHRNPQHLKTKDKFLAELPEKVDVHIVRGFHNIPIMKQEIPEIFERTKFSVLFPISNANSPPSTFKQKFPWVDMVIEDDSFLKPLPQKALVNASRTVPVNTPKKQLVYLATWSARKGQLILANAIKEHEPVKLMFAGKVMERDCKDQTLALLSHKGISYESLGYLKWDALSQLLRASDGLVLLSKADPSPRAVFEGLYFNLPFFISQHVELPAAVVTARHALGMSCNTSDPADVASKLEAFIATDFGTAPLDFAKEKLEESTVYWNLLQQINAAYERKFSPVKPPSSIWSQFRPLRKLVLPTLSNQRGKR